LIGKNRIKGINFFSRLNILKKAYGRAVHGFLGEEVVEDG